MYAKCFYTDVLTWMMKSHAMDDSEIYDDDDDDDDDRRVEPDELSASVCYARPHRPATLY